MGRECIKDLEIMEWLGDVRRVIERFCIYGKELNIEFRNLNWILKF